MPPDPDQDIEDLLASAVGEYHAARRRGAQPPTPSLPPELDQRYRRACETLELLRGACPRPGPSPLLAKVAAEVWPKQIAKFRLKEALGQGGFGIVFLAEDTQLKRLVALKVPHPTTLADPRARQRFLAEAEIMAEVQHPNVVPVYEAGEDGAWLYIASEHCPGPTLAAWTTGRQAAGLPLPPPREAARLLVVLARAVEHLHSRGVLHRDLKPGNILLTGDATECLGEAAPKITDFGLAKSLPRGGNDTRSEAALGTPGYAAPEQAGGRLHEVGAQTDVYALGAVLYELLTGRRACADERGAARWDDVLVREPTAPSRLARAPRDLETVCLKCLRKDAGARYQSARELADDLARFLDGRPVHARPVGPVERAAKWALRRPAAAGLAALAAAALLGLVVLAWRLSQAGQEAERRRRDMAALEKAAEVDRYHTLVARSAELSRSRPLGWTGRALAHLEAASRFQTEARDAVRLRSLAALCLGSLDLRPLATLAEGTDAFSVAFSPDGQSLAVGDRGPGPSCEVLIYDLDARALTRRLRAPALTPRPTGARVLAYHPRRAWLVVGTREGEVHRWDLSAPGPACLSFHAHSERVTGLAFLPDSDRVVSASTDGRVKVWEVGERATLIKELRPGGSVMSLAVQPDPPQLMVGGLDIGTYAFPLSHPNTEAAVGDRPTDRIASACAVCLSRDGTLRAHAVGNVFRMRYADTAGCDAEVSLPHPHRPAFAGELNHLEPHPSGGLLLAGSSDRLVKMWGLSNGRLAASLTAAGVGNVHPTFSPDGRRLAVTEDRRTALYAVWGLDVHPTVAHHLQPLRAIAFSPDGKRLACLAQETATVFHRRPAEVTTWDVATGGRLSRTLIAHPGRPPHRTGQPSLAYQPDSGGLALTTEFVRGVQVIDLRRGEYRSFPEAPLTWSLAFSPSGKRLWGILDARQDSEDRKVARSTDHVVSLSWPGRGEASRWAHEVNKHRRVSQLVAGERRVVAGTHNGTVKVLRAGDGQLETEWRVERAAPVCAVALSPREDLAASGTQAGGLQIVRLPDAAPVAEVDAHTDSLDALAFSPDGRLLASGGRDRDIHLWRRGEVRWEKVVTLAMESPVTALAYTPDGRTLGVVCHEEYAVRIWHLDRLLNRLKAMGLGW